MILHRGLHAVWGGRGTSRKGLPLRGQAKAIPGTPAGGPGQPLPTRTGSGALRGGAGPGPSWRGEAPGPSLWLSQESFLEKSLSEGRLHGSRERTWAPGLAGNHCPWTRAGPSGPIESPPRRLCCWLWSQSARGPLAFLIPRSAPAGPGEAVLSPGGAWPSEGASAEPEAPFPLVAETKTGPAPKPKAPESSRPTTSVAGICGRRRWGARPSSCRADRRRPLALQELSGGGGRQGCHQAPCHMCKLSDLSRARDPFGVRGHIPRGGGRAAAGPAVPAGKRTARTFRMWLAKVRVPLWGVPAGGDPRPGRAEFAGLGHEALGFQGREGWHTASVPGRTQPASSLEGIHPRAGSGIALGRKSSAAFDQ